MPDNNFEFDQDTAPEPMPRPQQGNFGETEVDPAQALKEAQAGESPATEAKGEEPQEREDVVDVLQPKIEPRKWRFGPEDMPLEYTQKPLSFLGKMQWFSLVGGVLDKAMAGPGGVSMSELLSVPGTGRQAQLTLNDFRDADTFIRALGKLVVHAPTFITDSYCIWLGVPETDRRLVSQIMAMPEDEGGLSDDQGLEIIETFIDQNYEAIADFFGGKISALQARVAQRAQERMARKGRVRA